MIITVSGLTLPEIQAEQATKQGLTIFAFDDYTIPFKDNLKLTLVSPQKYHGNPVVARGPAGSVDAYRAQFYGSVIRVGQKFRMWYAACSDGEMIGPLNASFQLAYAESDDGIHWVKPQLGLTPFQGNVRNNLVSLRPNLDYRRVVPLACFVLHEPENSDPSRHYKMIVYGVYYDSTDKKSFHITIYPYFSPDGLKWTLAVPTPKGQWFDENEAPFTAKHNFEAGGLYKFDGIYYVPGQEFSPDITMPDGTPVRRTMVTHWSGDFINWSQDRSFSFQRYGYRSVRQSLEEAHEPASVWNRGNILLGLYGLWHGATMDNERRMDLGFLISNDGIHFREPIADHVFIKAGEDGEWDQRGLIQGQGYENVDDKTYIYYGTWDLSAGAKTTGAIGLAMLRRDGFGFLSIRQPGKAQLTTLPIANSKSQVSLYMNVDGLSRDGYIRVELIDKLGSPIPGYSGNTAAIVTESGLKTKVTWPSTATLKFPNPKFRVRLKLEGNSSNKIKLFACYIE